MQTAVLSNGRLDVYGAVTEKIVAAIEAGAGAYGMPWHRLSPALGRPANAQSGARYQGINVVALWAAAVTEGYGSGWWATYRQWEELGGQVRRGEHGTVAVFYKRATTEIEEGDGDEARPRFVARAFRLFNQDQVDGWTPSDALSLPVVPPIDAVEAFVGATGAVVRPGGDLACYVPAQDLIQMPGQNQFTGADPHARATAYYATLLHELTHWTGAPHRLTRQFGTRFGDDAYAMEELVAELGAAFLCADLGISNEPRPDHAAYLASWLRVLKADRRAVFTAAKRAKEAAGFLAQCSSHTSGAL